MFKSLENKITRLLRNLKNKLDVIFSYSMEEGTKIGTIYEYIWSTEQIILAIGKAISSIWLKMKKFLS